MQAKRWSIAVAVSAVVAMLLSSCTFLNPEYPPGYVETRKANLESAVGEFDAQSIGQVICDVSSGEVSPNNGFRRKIVIGGRESWQPTIDRLDLLKYETSSGDPWRTGTRSDGISVAVRVIDRAGDEPEIESELAESGCEVPQEGAVSINFLEGDPFK